MLRDQMSNFLEAAVVLLMLTNVFSIGAAAYALARAQFATRADSRVARMARSSLCDAGCARSIRRDKGALP